MLQRIKHDIMYHLQHAGVPSSPGRPVIELSTNRIQAQSDENSVTDEINLAWDVPDDDGGYPITGKMERSCDWPTAALLSLLIHFIAS